MGIRSAARSASLAVAAGAVGGLGSSLAVWAAGRAGFTHALGVAIAPALTKGWLYPRLVWGGLWGLLFALPFAGRSWIAQGLLLSLGPALVQLFVVLPQTGHRVAGLDLGTLTPAVVLLATAVWGLAAAAWLRLCGR
jgi:hypothetical protein